MEVVKYEMVRIQMLVLYQSGFRPKRYFYFAWTAMGGDINNQSARIEVNGNISLYLPAEKTTSNWAFNISFPI